MRLCLMAQPSTIEIYYRVQSQQLLFLLHIIYQFVSGAPAAPRQSRKQIIYFQSRAIRGRDKLRLETVK